MANLIIQENGAARTTPALHGEEITIQAPCDCSAVTGVQIAGIAYPFYDAAGNPLESGSGLFTTDNLIRVMIDTENARAYILNHAVTPAQIGAYTKAEVDTKLSMRALAFTYGTEDIEAGTASTEPEGTLHLIIE